MNKGRESVNYKSVVSETEVVGNIFLNPSILDKEKYYFTEMDFSSELNRTLFGAMFNLHQNGVTKFEIKDIENYLADKMKSKAVYDFNKGSEFLKELSKTVSLSSFEYYYNRLKKFSLMRAFSQKVGMDLSWLYDDNNLLDVRKKEAQDKWLDEIEISDLSDCITRKISEVELEVTYENKNHVYFATDGLWEYLQQLKKSPNIGLSMYGKLRTGINKGARKGCFFLRSGQSGAGKTRSMIADACVLGCSEYYEDGEWVKVGNPQPVEYIMVEQKVEEVQILMIAFLSGVDRIEYHSNELTKDEEERILKAYHIFNHSKIHINILPQYDLTDMKNNIKFAITDRATEYIFFDYIENNIKMLEEITKRAGGKISLREDQILFMICNALKDIASTFNVFIESGTQLNGEWKTSEHMDSSMLAGGKSMDRKIDYGEIMIKTSPVDIEKIQHILTNSVYPVPDIKVGIYKNRGSKIDNHILWCKANKGICRIDPLFITDYNYELVSLDEDYFIIEEGEEVVKMFTTETSNSYGAFEKKTNNVSTNEQKKEEHQEEETKAEGMIEECEKGNKIELKLEGEDKPFVFSF